MQNTEEESIGSTQAERTAPGLCLTLRSHQ